MSKGILCFQVLACNHTTTRKIETRLCSSLSSKDKSKRTAPYQSLNLRSRAHKTFLHSLWQLNGRFISQGGFFLIKPEFIPQLRKFAIGIRKKIKCSERFNNLVPVFSFRIIVTMMLAMTLGVAVSRTPSCKLLLVFLNFLKFPKNYFSNISNAKYFFGSLRFDA